MDESALRVRFRARLHIAAPEIVVVGIPNAAKRGQRAMNQARREGAKWGFPDDLVLWPGGVAFVEWKTDKGKLDARQVEWLARLSGMGFPAIVGRDPDQVIAWLRSLGAPFLFAEAA